MTYKRAFPILLSVAALASCSLPFLRLTPPEPLKVAGIFDCSKRLAALDAPASRGAQLAIEEINSQGGLLERPVELVLKDTRPTTRRIQESVEQAIYQDKVSAIIGFSDTNQVLAADPLAQAAGIPLIAVGATSPRMTSLGGGTTLALTAFGDNAQAGVAAEFAREQFGPRGLIIYENSRDYPILYSRYFKKRFEELGGQIIGSFYYVGFPPRLNPILRNLKGPLAKPDFVLLATMPTNAAWVIRQLRGAGIHAPIMGGPSFDIEEVRSAAPLETGQIYFTTHAFLNGAAQPEHVKEFVARYTKRFGKAPENSFAALGYDAVMLYAEAVKRTRSTDATKVMEAIEGLQHFDGVAGARTYGPGRRVPFKNVSVIRLGTSGPELVLEKMPEKAPVP